MATGVDGVMRVLKRYRYLLLITINLGISYLVYQGFWAWEFAETYGCRVDEAGVYPCIVDGFDYGPQLANKTIIVIMMGFMSPIVIFPFLLLIIFLLIDAFKYLRTKKTSRTSKDDSF